MSGSLEGKSAIVTGAGSGVGRVSAVRFAGEGARVIVADINVDNAKETVRDIESAGGTAIAIGVDVSNEQQVQAMIAAAVDQYGRLDGGFRPLAAAEEPGTAFHGLLNPAFDSHRSLLIDQRRNICRRFIGMPQMQLSARCHHAT